MGHAREAPPESESEGIHIEAVHEEQIEAGLHPVHPIRHSKRSSMTLRIDEDPAQGDGQGRRPYHDIEQPPRQGGGLEVRGYLARSRIEEIGEGDRKSTRLNSS